MSSAASFNPRTIFVGLLVLALGYLSYLLFDPFLTFLLAAALLAFLVYPLHTRLAPVIGRRLSALTLVIFVTGGTILPLIVIGYLIIDSLEGITEGIDEIALIERVEEIILTFTGLDIDLLVEFEAAIIRLANAALGELADIVAATLHFFIGLLLLVFVLFYLILDGHVLLQWIREVSPIDDDIQTEFLDETHLITWAVIKSHLFVAIIEGLLTGVGLYLAGVPNVAFWTVVMIILAILPIVGVSLVWAPAVAYLVYIGAFPEAAFLFIYGGIVINLDSYFRAILVDRDTQLHPAVVLVGVLGGLYVFGILGLFIGPIILAVFKATVNVFSRNITVTDLSSSP